MKPAQLVVLLTILFFVADIGVIHAVPPADLPAQAAAGDAQAQFELGKKYNHGLDKAVKKNYIKAEKWLKEAAAQNHSEAMFHLGVMQETGRGFIPDAVAAADWYLEAANGGNPDAMYTLSLMYEEGRGVPQDPVEAAFWYQRATDVWSNPTK